VNKVLRILFFLFALTSIVQPILAFVIRDNNISLLYLAALNLVSIFFSAKFNRQVENKIRIVSVNEIDSPNLFYLSCICAISVFLVYQIDESMFSSIDAHTQFTHRYRNGMFKGTYLYTMLGAKILPLIIAYYILKCKISMRRLIIPLTTSVFIVATLGLRVFLMPIVISIILSQSKSSGSDVGFSKKVKIFIQVIAVIIVLTGIRLTRNEEENRETSLTAIVQNLLMRHDLEATVPSELYNYSMDGIFVGPYSFNPSLRNVTFKESYYGSNGNFEKFIGFAGNLNASALPGHVLNYILFGPLAILPTIAILLIIKYLVGCIAISIGAIKSIWWLDLLTILVGCAFEDAFMLWSIIEVPFHVVLTSFIIKIISRKLVPRYFQWERGGA
jgi:hypothetical protein